MIQVSVRHTSRRARTCLISNLKKHLDGSSVLLDCGAHMGVQHTLSDCFEKVFAFEAQRNIFSLCGNLFKRNYKRHSINAGVTAADKTHTDKTARRE